MAIQAEKLVAEVVLEKDKAEAGLRNFGEKAGKQAGPMNALKTAVVGFGIAGAVAFGGGMVMQASDLGESVNKNNVVFGESAGVISGYADSMAKAFGANKTEVLDAASSLGLLGKAAGQSEGEAAKMSKSLVGLAADASSFYNVPLAQATQDFASALSGESEPVKKYGVLMNETAVQAEALALGLAKPGQELTEGMKVQARASLLMKGMGDAQGDLARTQDGFANQLRKAQGMVANWAATIGQKAIPAATALLGWAMGAASALGTAAGFIGDHATAFGIVAAVITAVLLPALIRWGVTSTVSAAKSVASWVAAQAASIASAWAQVASVARVIAGWIAMGVQAVANAARVVAGWVLMGTQSLIQAARMAAAWFIAMGPVGWVIAAVIALVALIVANWDTVKRVTVQIWGGIVAWLKGAWASIKGAASSAWNAIKSAISAVLGAIRSAITTYFNAYRAVVMAVFNAIRSVISTAVNGWRNIISTALNAVLGIFRGLGGRILGALSGLAGTLRNAGANIIQALADGISGAVGRAVDAVKGVLSKVRDFLPFSPARKGPFSGKGWSLFSGRSIAQDLARGMIQRARGVARAAGTLARAAAGTRAAYVITYGGPTAPRRPPGPPPTFPGGPGLSPAAYGSAGPGGPGAGQQFVFNTYYPVAEPQSQTVNRSLQRLAAFSLAATP